MSKLEARPLPFSAELTGISEKTLAIHHDKLYAGYVAKVNEVREKLQNVDLSTANQSYSDLRSLKDGESFALNGVYLHEDYFNVLGGDGRVSDSSLRDAIAAEFGSLETFEKLFKACGMAARGWVVLAHDTHDGKLHLYTADAHNQGGVWGAIPVLVLDVYEHAYFLDYGADRKAYIEDYWKNLNWGAANAVFERADRF